MSKSQADPYIQSGQPTEPRHQVATTQGEQASKRERERARERANDVSMRCNFCSTRTAGIRMPSEGSVCQVRGGTDKLKVAEAHGAIKARARDQIPCYPYFACGDVYPSTSVSRREPPGVPNSDIPAG